MADEQAVYEAVAQTMRDYGYRAVTAAAVREIDKGPPTERQSVIATFAARQLQQARESGLLPPAGAAGEPPSRSLDAEQEP